MLTCSRDDQGTQTHGGRARHPSEKQKQLECEQWEMTRHRDAKAQKTRERHHLRQLAEQGSENNTNEEGEEDDQSSIDDKDTHTKLSRATKEQLVYCDSKIPKSLNIEACKETSSKHKKSKEMHVEHRMQELRGLADYVVTNYQLSKHRKVKETRREIVSMDDEPFEEFHQTSSSDHQSCKHKSMEMHADHRTPELEGTTDYMAHPKRQWLPAKDLDPTVVKAQKLTKNEGHPRARDYDDITQEFMATVIREYRACLCVQVPMPDHTQESSLLNASWARAFQVTGVNLACTLQLAKLVRGQLKSKLWPLVEAIYGFYSSQSKSAIKKNRALVEELKEGMNFAFKHMAAQEDGQHGFLKAPLIQKIMNTMWFANKHDDGIIFPNHFKLFPYPALALVLTAVECCIDKWMTGTWMDITFTIQEYHNVFDLHLNCLQACEVRRVHSGAAPLITPSQSAVSMQVIADAIKEYEEGSTTNNESE
ncbi:hypothetical protein EDC04DRAFT_2904168 [Pisolithus marmoratus]|nr:hypothetical protein EDC04DRAFT_2904168 [Pisolithus marmoratus]